MKPSLYIKIFKSNISSFHFFGVLGYIVGVVLGLILSMILGHPMGVVLLLALLCMAIFFILIVLAKKIAGEEVLVYYHHEIVIAGSLALCLWLLHLPVLNYLDIWSVGMAAFLCFGRIGCYSVGCCHGRPHKHGITYGQNHVDAGFTWYYKDIPLLPVQLIESGYVLCILVTGIVLLLNHAVPGTVLLLYTVIYGAMRFIIEYFRGDPERPIWVGLSEAQWTSLLLISITYGFSQVGWLPVYNWHLIILLLLVCASLIRVCYSIATSEDTLFNPAHLGELAEGLKVLEVANAHPATMQTDKVNVFTTSKGLLLSCSKMDIANIRNHYTISLKNNRIKMQSADKIARIIGLLKKFPTKYEIIKKRNGVFHILFVDPLQYE